MMMVDVTMLVADHDRLAALSDRLVQLVGERHGDTHGAYLLLRDLACELDAHLAVEDVAIYADALRGGKSGALGNFERDLAELTAEWAIYLREWTLENIEEDWQGFGQATNWMMQRLSARIAVENSLLMPMAPCSEAMQLRAA